MVRKAEELCKEHGWFLCHQFENEANWKFHELTTGPEILADLVISLPPCTHAPLHPCTHAPPAPHAPLRPMHPCN